MEIVMVTGVQSLADGIYVALYISLANLFSISPILEGILFTN